MSNIQTLSTTLPFDYQNEQRGLDRKRKLAELLQQQSMQQDPTNQMVGGIVVRNSPLAGLAKVLGSYMAGKQQETLDQKEKDLSARVLTNRQSVLADALKRAQGTPAQDLPPTTPNDDEGNANPQISMPAKPGDQTGAAAMLLGSNDPMLSGMGTTMLANALRGSESLFSKVDPKDYTPESVAVYAKTKDPAQLVPVRKMELANLGGASQAYNPYSLAPGQSLPHTATPDTTARLKQGDEHWRGLSGYQQQEIPIQRGNLAVNQGQLSNARTNTYFNTGMGPGGGGAPAPLFATGGAAMPATGPRSAVPAPALPAQGPVAPSAPGGPLLPPAMQGRITPKQQAELAVNQPHAQQSLENVNISIDNAVKQVDDLLKAPGLDNITGPIAGRLPSILGSSTNAQAKLDTLRSQIGVQVLTAMREASKTGGAVGNVTEKEWPILQNQYEALQQAQTSDQFRSALRGVKETLERVRANAGGAYKANYGGTGGGMPSASAIDAELARRQRR